MNCTRVTPGAITTEVMSAVPQSSRDCGKARSTLTVRHLYVCPDKSPITPKGGIVKCKSLIFKFSLWAAMCSLSIAAPAQTTTVTAATAPNSAVPRLINYSGILRNSDGKTMTTITGVTFLLYKDDQRGAALWLETQNVTPDRTGHYSVQLGTTSANGLPSDLFVSGEARWLAVQVVHDAEQARVLLVAVPYAMKAADAETIGGLPPSAFVLAAPPRAETTRTTTENIPAPLSSFSVSPLASSN